MTAASRVKRSGAVTVRGIVYMIQLYRSMVSPMRLPTCRFTPTCSQYAVDALTEFGLVRGGWLAVVRLLKCGPWHRGGWDPIPDTATPGEPVQEQQDRVAEHRNMTATDFDRDIPAERGESKSSV